MNKLKRIYFEYRQICASEAVQRLLPTLNLKYSNLQTKFVTSGFPENRSTMYRKCDDIEDQNEEEDEDSEDDEAEFLDEATDTFAIEGRKGKFQKVKTIHERYSNRPQNDALDDMCLAEFATIYQIAKKPQGVVFIDQVTEANIEAYNISTPKWIYLKDGSYMQARGTPAVLRMHNSKKKRGHEEQYSELLLFFPWKNESELHASEPETVVAMYQNNLHILIKTENQFYHFLQWFLK